MNFSRIFLLGTAVAAYLCSCAKETEVTEDMTAYGLSGKVDSIIVRTYKAVRIGGTASKGSPSGGTNENFTVSFDSDGNAVERKGYDTAGNLLEHVTWAWNEDHSVKTETHAIPRWDKSGAVYSYNYRDGKETGGSVTDQNGNVACSWKNKYDGTGITETVISDEDGNTTMCIKKNHDSKGMVTSAETFDSEGTSVESNEYEYDSDGRLTMHSCSEGWKMEAEYNGKGLVEKVVNGNGNLWSEKSCGIWNSLRCDKCTGETVITRNYKYEYDSDGNWVTRTTLIDDIVVEITERTICD